MKLLKLNNEYYLIGDDELEINARDSYYVGGHITESAGGEVEKGDYRDCEKVLAATVQLRGLPLIDRNEIETIFKECTMALGRKKMREIHPHSLLTNAIMDDFADKFSIGYNEALKDSDKNFTPDEMIDFCQECLIVANSNEIGRVRKFIDERLDAFIRKPKTEWWYCVSVDGTTVPYHSKKWNKTLGRIIPSVNDKGHITIKSIHKQ